MIGSLGKDLESRIVEVVCGSGVTYGVNRFLLKNEYNMSDMIPRVIAIGVADVVAEILTELILRS